MRFPSEEYSKDAIIFETFESANKITKDEGFIIVLLFLMNTYVSEFHVQSSKHRHVERYERSIIAMVAERIENKMKQQKSA